MNPNAEIDMLTTPDDRARLLMSTLREVNVTSKVGTPCGILAKLWITSASDPDSPLSPFPERIRHWPMQLDNLSQENFRLYLCRIQVLETA